MHSLQPGRVLAGGRYTIRRSLSRGGMGEIYLAADRDAFERTVVIKTLLDPEAPADPAEQRAAQERLLREARTLAALRFPTIPQIYACFQEGGQTYIAMEYIEGTDLSAALTRADEASGQLVAGRPAPMASVLRWGVALCRTLEYLAACAPPVVHQDIKPANLILARDSGELYLVDFGAARLRPVAAPGGGKTAIFGTPGYAAPEQFQGHSEPRSDVYALAATLYHLATDDDPAEHLFHFPRLAHMGYVGRILGGALQRDPAARPTATELRVQLEALGRADGTRPLRAPDGSVLFVEAELVAWCERNWHAAAAWLSDSLPRRVEADWVRPDLARSMRQWSAPFATEPERGLDAVLARLDPRGIGAARPQLQPDRSEVDLGECAVEQPMGVRLRLRNDGRRYVDATLEHPAWLRARPTEIVLAPGESADVSFELTRLASGTRLNTGTLTVRAGLDKLIVLPVEGKAAEPRRRAEPTLQIAFLVTLITGAVLFMLAALLSTVLQNL